MASPDEDFLEISGTISDGGTWIGKDPRRIPTEILAQRFAAKNPLRALRARCLDCCCGQPNEVRKCISVDCPSWPFRMGKNPFRRKPKMSEAERDRRTALLRKARVGQPPSPKTS